MNHTAIAIWPPRGSSVGVASWLREIAGLVRALFSAPRPPDDAARGQGEAVLIVPGFCSPEASTVRLRRFLTRQGFAARSWGCGANFGPSRRTLEAFERRLITAAERGPVWLIGVSLGGVLAREMAKHRPDLVAGVITLASPINLPVPTPLAPLVQLAARRWSGEAAKRFAALAEPPPVPLMAVVSPKDGVVDWRCCVPRPAPAVETVMIEAAHLTIASDPLVQKTVAGRLARAPA